MENLQKNKMPHFDWVAKDPTVKDPYKTKLGISAVSRVSSPAMEAEFVALHNIDSQMPTISFKFSAENFDDSRQWIIGPILIPNKLIEREFEVDTVIAGQTYPAGTRYTASITDKEIEFALEKFFYDQNNNKTNLQHRIPNDGDFAFLSWIKLSDAPIYKGDNYQKGTAILGYKVMDTEKYQDIKSGKSNQFGFSIEAKFGLVPSDTKLQLQNIKQEKMKKFENVKLTDIMTQDGQTITVDDVTYACTYQDGSVVPDGDYTLQDGSIITVQGGILVDVQMGTQNTNNQNPAQSSAPGAGGVPHAKKLENTTTTTTVEHFEKNEKGEDIIKTQPAAAAQVIELSAKDLNTKLEELTKKFSAVEIELNLTKALNAELTAKNEKLSKLPTVTSLNTTPARDAVSNSLTEVELSKMAPHELIAYHAMNFKRAGGK